MDKEGGRSIYQAGQEIWEELQAYLRQNSEQDCTPSQKLSATSVLLDNEAP